MTEASKETAAAVPGDEAAAAALLEKEVAAAAPMALPTATAESSASLDKSLVMGIAWTGGMKWTTQIISWASTIIVARILSPADYGVMGMAAVYVNFVMLVNEFGLTAAILQRRDMTEEQIAKIGGFGALIGLAFTAVSLALAFPIAAFYGDPAVRFVIMWLSINFTISALGILPRALLARDLQFQRLAWIDGLTSLTQVAVTISLALLGFRYYSLVFSSIVAGFVGLLIALAWHGHRLAWPSPFDDIKRSIHVGWHLVVGRIAWYTYQNADFAVVGRVLGKVLLGAYTIGWEIATVPVERVSALVGQVTPGIFATVQDNIAALRRYFLGIVGGLSIITFPAAAGLAMTAHPLVMTLLGDKWLPAVLPMQILAAYAGIRSIDTVTPQVLVFTGHSRAAMWFSVLAACLLPGLFYLGSRWGLAGVAMTWVLAYPIVMLPAYRLLFRVLEMSPLTYFNALWPATSSTLVMVAALWFMEPRYEQWLPAKAVLVADVLTGAVVYAAMLLLLHRERVMAFKQLIQRVRS